MTYSQILRPQYPATVLLYLNLLFWFRAFLSAFQRWSYLCFWLMLFSKSHLFLFSLKHQRKFFCWILVHSLICFSINIFLYKNTFSDSFSVVKFKLWIQYFLTCELTRLLILDCYVLPHNSYVVFNSDLSQTQMFNWDL